MPSNEVLSQSSTTQFLNALSQPPEIANSVGVTLGDVNGDDSLDAIVVNYNGQANQLLLNDGYGRFTESFNALPGLVSSNDVSLGDLDGDGDLDAFIVNNGVANQVLLNNGGGAFTLAHSQPVGDRYSYAVSLGDVDNDGDLDAFVANYWGEQNQLFFNDGTGAFTESAIALPGQHYSNDVALGDLDQDGDLDAFVANYSKQANQVLLNDGTGLFSEAPHQPVGNGSSAEVSLGDLDSDGDLDGFVANFRQANHVLLNNGTSYYLSGEGVFTTNDQGTLTVDYLFDGGGFNKGQLGIFSLSGMEDLNPKSDEFLQEAARRATSGSDLGHVVIRDQQEAARFRGTMAWERTTNRGRHVGQQTFEMAGGDRFALINVGKAKGKSLKKAIKTVYKDCRPDKPGQQPLKKNQAFLIEHKRNVYLGINDRNHRFSQRNDLFLDLGQNDLGLNIGRIPAKTIFI